MAAIEFFVHGRPAPQGSKSQTRTGHMYEASRYVKPWRLAVTEAAQVAARDVLWTPLDEGLWLRVAFYVRRPKSHYGTGRNALTVKASAPPRPTGPPDTSKLVRSTEDSLKGVIWRDDALVVSCLSEKFWADDRGSGAFIRISTEELRKGAAA